MADLDYIRDEAVRSARWGTPFAAPPVAAGCTDCGAPPVRRRTRAIMLHEEASNKGGSPCGSTLPAPLVSVIRLPNIANFTDFAALEGMGAVRLRYVKRKEELTGAALVILPGSKDTLADLRWLHATGFADGLRRHVASGGRLAGICGGFQMLGRAVEEHTDLAALTRLACGGRLARRTTPTSAGELR